MYEPIAEDRKVALLVDAEDEVAVHGNHDLRFDAIANLVDNAVKFTPQGGRVELSLARAGDKAGARARQRAWHRGEHDHVARRFYRSDKSRCAPGLGLGPSLVTAIMKLRGFRFAISAGPGCVAEIAGQPAAA